MPPEAAGLGGVAVHGGAAAPALDPAVLDEVHQRLLLAAGGGADDLRRRALSLLRQAAPLLGTDALAAAADAVVSRVAGLGALDPILADPAVTDVMVNGPGPVWAERAGQLEQLAVDLDRSALELLIERIVGPLGLRADRSAPLVDARLPDGSRVNVVMPPLAVDGPCLTIRRFGARPVPLAASCSPGVARLLRWAVDARLNLVVAGGTGAGKTTLLNALAGHIPHGERVVTVEDAAELRLPGEHVVRLEARPANAEGAGEVRVRELVRNALRMRPDRIIVGECRGGEALDMLQAMNTGHEGSMSTCHANSPHDALRRLETMVLQADVALPLPAVRQQLVAAVDLLVQMARRPGGDRRVVAVAEVVGADDGAACHVRELTAGGCLLALPHRPARREGASAPDPAWTERS